MPHSIAHLFEPLLRLLLPAPGRHRAPDQPSAGLCVEASTVQVQQRGRTRRRVAEPAAHGIAIDAELVDRVEVRAW
ncbi:hypothetical protein ABT301_17985 [Streptomyces sp. NPDC000987]|uniref:hypothetical protein n=1 Tax=Streptomyces sp. NPDC000987 TaxID=3154374 RepID=UPI003328E6D5